MCLAVVTQEGMINVCQRCAAHGDTAAAVAAASEADERHVSGAIVQVDSVDLEGLHHQIGNEHMFGMVQGNARLLACIAEMVIAGQLAGVDAEIDLAVQEAPLAGLKLGRSTGRGNNEGPCCRPIIEK